MRNLGNVAALVLGILVGALAFRGIVALADDARFTDQRIERRFP